VKARPVNGERSLSESAYLSLRQAIHNGRFRPGDRMREAEIALWLGISRTPVRDALQRLEGDGLVTAAPRRGLVVTQIEPGQVSELYAVREVLEGLAGRLAAQHASSAEIDAMRDLLQRQAKMGRDDAALARLNRQFRDLVHRATHNRFLVSALETFEAAVAVLPSPAFATSGHGAASLKDHTDLLRAIERRDSDRAADLSAGHMRAMARLQLLQLSEDAEPPRRARRRA